MNDNPAPITSRALRTYTDKVIAAAATELARQIRVFAPAIAAMPGMTVPKALEMVAHCAETSGAVLLDQ